MARTAWSATCSGSLESLTSFWILKTRACKESWESKKLRVVGTHNPPEKSLHHADNIAFLYSVSDNGIEGVHLGLELGWGFERHGAISSLRWEIGVVGVGRGRCWWEIGTRSKKPLLIRNQPSRVAVTYHPPILNLSKQRSRNTPRSQPSRASMTHVKLMQIDIDKRAEIDGF